MAEVSRLESVAADQSKADFIGSISHELRSPLHGILASNEFLGDTDCDGYQRNMIDTIDSCGRTLLDTINHVLDYSKINSFQKSWQRAQRKHHRGHGYGNPANNAGTVDAVNLLAQVEVNHVLEEVIEGNFELVPELLKTFLLIHSIIPGISAGQAFQSSGLEVVGSDLSVKPGSSSRTTVVIKPVTVIIDIAKHDWTFVTQPGALRRIFMNLFGNAIKYTEQGYVECKLEIRKLDEPNANGCQEIVSFTVSDTGKGISNEYLGTNLFTPFSQENAMAPGTGLGLSIVRAIVRMLHGTIEVKSELNKGTEVRVCLPLGRSSTKDTPQSTPTSASSPDHPQEESISLLRERWRGKSVAIHGFDPSDASGPGRAQGLLKKSLQNYISEWFELKSINDSSQLPSADIIIAEEDDLPMLCSTGVDHPRGQHRPPLVVICRNTSTYYRNQKFAVAPGVIEFVSLPFGPKKLARSLHVALERENELRRRITGPTPIDAILRETHLAGADRGPLGSPFEEVSLEKSSNVLMPVNACDNRMIISDKDNANAHRAAPGLCPSPRETIINRTPEYPFPAVADADAMASKNGSTSRGSRTPEQVRHSFLGGLNISSSDTTQIGPQVGLSHEKWSSITLRPTIGKRSPRILLVDDNKINLRLLETFMKKRKYEAVDKAEDGQCAVEAVRRNSEGYDVIFMDISMPVLNGFEATRQIRQMEVEARFRIDPVPTYSAEDGSPLAEDRPKRSPALIIALTGLASSRDQSEALLSGVDLFMTKPVSFREVGRLLDNWETNNETGAAMH
ncbi:MAG: hypothetical protein M1819_006219 [Sarea resinae]|nr:MAG: hypothetical protein M1819_006219 [Sarea resinae]